MGVATKDTKDTKDTKNHNRFLGVLDVHLGGDLVFVLFVSSWL